VAALVVAGFIARTFLRNWSEFARTPLDLEFRPAWIAASALLVWSAYGLLIGAWRALAASWAPPLPLPESARVWAVSSLGKYVPGKVWAFAGMALLAERAGMPGWAATGAALLMQALALATGVLVISVCGTAALEAAHPGARLVLLLLALASLAGVALAAWPPLATRLLARVARGGQVPGPPRPGALLGGAGANLAAWLIYGAALWSLARGILGEVSLPFAASAGAFAASYLAGVLAIFAPGGLVVREALFIVLREPVLGLPSATALAVASRLLLTLTEVGLALPFLTTRRSVGVES
jgi:hypothetical protein